MINLGQLHKKRDDWRREQTRLKTESYNRYHPRVKASAPVDITKRVSIELAPSFDPNKNDIWSKRMNTLRRFIALVSRWLVRKRLTRRFGKLMGVFAKAGVTTREEARSYIEQENESYKSNGPMLDSSKLGKNESGRSSIEDSGKPGGLAALICSLPNKAITEKTSIDIIIATKKIEFSRNMCRRVLFPKYSADEAAVRMPLETANMDIDSQFDDRTYFQLKVRPEWITMGYDKFSAPVVPLHFPLMATKELRSGATEENSLRPPADKGLQAIDLLKSVPVEAELLKFPSESLILQRPLTALEIDASSKISSATDSATVIEPEKAIVIANVDDDINLDSPSWLTCEPIWSLKERDYFRPRPDLRVYNRAPRRKETDPDWMLRPFNKEIADKLVYQENDSLRSHLLQVHGFTSAHVYLLGSHETSSVDPPPPPGPTLVDQFIQDVDRHASGLFCFSRDHSRSLTEYDPDLGPLQSKNDSADHLTDSESDNEDGYAVVNPTIFRARSIVHPPPKSEPDPVPAADPKGAKGALTKGGKLPIPVAVPEPVAAPATNDTLGTDAFSLLDESQRKREQVELLRDRKILDQESSIRKQKYQRINEVQNKLFAISTASKCAIQALPVQVSLILNLI